jgi:hypothetical protein
MVQTSAWLAGQVPAIADELISRSPFNLLRYGDPGSLPIATRVKAFDGAIGQVEGIDTQKLWFMDDNLRRLAHPALDPHFPQWWEKAKNHKEGRHLVLRLIRVGRQHGGLEIARSVAFDQSADEISQLIAARALIDIGTTDDEARYAQHVLAHYADLPRSIVLQALDVLFPGQISINQFFMVIDAIGIADDADDGGQASISPIGPEVPDGLRAAADLEQFLSNIVARSGALTGDREDHPFRNAFSALAVSSALRLVDAYPDAIPDVVTDLVLLLHESDRHGLSKELFAAFGATTGRRRTSFWRAVERLRDHPWMRDSEDMTIWSVQHLGWPVIVGAEDIDWFIADVRDRADLRDKRTALMAAHTLWRQFSNDPEILEKLKQAAQIDPALASQLGLWLAPSPRTAEMIEQTERMEAARRRNEEQAAARDQSWVELISKLRADPSFFDDLSPQTEQTVDSRLFHLWQFVSWRGQSRSRYSINNLDTVAPIFGPELTRRFREALIAFAYARTPPMPDDMSAEARSISNFDIMALAGVSLAAGTIPGWAEKIDAARADQAARLAMIELNGFPDYLLPLSYAHPDVVRKVLMGAVEAQLGRANSQAHGILDRLEYADPRLSQLLASDLELYLKSNVAIPPAMLEKIVSVLIRVAPLSSQDLHTLARQRAHDAQDPLEAAYYLLLLFGLEGDSAVEVLREKMAGLEPKDKAILCCNLLPRLFGDLMHRSVEPPKALSVDSLVQLLMLAFEGVRPSDDIHRPSGKVYSRELRDEAQDAREMIFHRLTKTPGEAAQAALERLSAIPNFPIRPEWVRIHAFRHAEADAELAAWMPDDVLTFERTFDRAPTTTADLQLLARRRIEGIQHDLINGRFSQGDTLQGLVDENAVQRWLATQFDARKAESYTVQRETHYADEKEPDITLISRHSGVELPIEVKVVDGLSVAQLEAALEIQLCEQYLRHDSTRHGILLLVYQEARALGWDLTPG